MSWLAKLTLGRSGTSVAEAIPETNLEPEVEPGPPIMVLVNDASGCASFKTQVFADAASATEWVQRWLPQAADDGITAFWAMTKQPDAECSAESLVMIRDAARDGVVYLFSFLDIESAQQFLRKEVERGTMLSAMMLYWAVPVRAETDRWGKMTLKPSTPTGAVSIETASQAPERDGWVVRRDPPVVEDKRKEPAGNARALLKEAPNAFTGVAAPMGAGIETFELTAWMDRPRPRPSSQADVVEEAAKVVAASEEVFEEAVEEVEPHAVEEAQDAIAAAAAEAALDEVEIELAIEPATVLEEVTEDALEEGEPAAILEATAIIEAAIGVTETVTETEAVAVAGSEIDEHQTRVRADVNGNGHKQPQAGEVVLEVNGHKDDDKALAELSEPETPNVLDLPEHEVSLPSTNGHTAANGHTPEVTSPGGEGSEGVAHDVEHDGRIAAEAQVHAEPLEFRGVQLESRALQVKRWEVKDGPFEGFKSPPGKF